MDNDFVSADRLMCTLSNGEFEPYLQAVVSASDLTVSGAELLVRWHMPAGEIIKALRAFPPFLPARTGQGFSAVFY